MKKASIIFLLQDSGRGLFTTRDLKKLLNIDKDNTLYKTIEGLIKEKILIYLCKGKYLYRNVKPGEFEIANFLYPPSYISLESALNFYNILIQTPYIISSVTPKNVGQIETIFPVSPYPIITHLSAEEILSEKIRAILKRTKARDIFDVWFLMSKEVGLNWKMVEKRWNFMRKKQP